MKMRGPTQKKGGPNFEILLLIGEFLGFKTKICLIYSKLCAVDLKCYIQTPPIINYGIPTPQSKAGSKGSPPGKVFKFNASQTTFWTSFRCWNLCSKLTQYYHIIYFSKNKLLGSYNKQWVTILLVSTTRVFKCVREDSVLVQARSTATSWLGIFKITNYKMVAL